jgi:hypothetical protein
MAVCPVLQKGGAHGQFPAKGDGKPTLMRYIIRDQAKMTEYCKGE